MAIVAKNSGALRQWLLGEPISVTQASLLADGLNPVDYESHSADELNLILSTGAKTHRHTILRAIAVRKIPARIVLLNGASQGDEEDNLSYRDIDPERTEITPHAVTDYFALNKIEDQLFNPSPRMRSQDFDLRGPYFPYKLQAALRAWAEVTSNPENFSGSSPKQKIAKWLEANAKELALLNSDNSLNKGGIDQISMVANWQTQGGAPKTPTR